MMLIPLERDRTHTLLGVRFWDRLTQQPITAGLRVTAQRLSDDLNQRVGKAVIGKVTPSGTIAFFGLTAAEKPLASDPDLWDSYPPEQDQWVAVDLVDQRSQFLPLSFRAPLPYRGIFRGQDDLLSTSLLRPEVEDNQALGIQLWSASTRLVPPGRAVIRAQLVIGETVIGEPDTPAAYALVQVRLDPPSSDASFDYFGMADEEGKLVLLMPYPRLPEPVSAATPYPPLEQQTFALQITVQYQADRDQLPDSSVPNLENLLTQSPADIGVLRNPDPPHELQPQEDLKVDLQFGKPLTLRTAGKGENAPQESVLRILPS